MAKKKYFSGQLLDGKVIHEVFRDSSTYMITFTDGTYTVKKINE